MCTEAPRVRLVGTISTVKQGGVVVVGDAQCWKTCVEDADISTARQIADLFMIFFSDVFPLTLQDVSWSLSSSSIRTDNLRRADALSAAGAAPLYYLRIRKFLFSWKSICVCFSTKHVMFKLLLLLAGRMGTRRIFNGSGTEYYTFASNVIPVFWCFGE